jgi:hypothetical protein
LCQGNCVTTCVSGALRDPTDCSCCVRNGGFCIAGGLQCCGKPCQGGGLPAQCAGLDDGDPCDFDEQCASDICNADVCV